MLDHFTFACLVGCTIYEPVFMKKCENLFYKVFGCCLKKKPVPPKVIALDGSRGRTPPTFTKMNTFSEKRSPLLARSVTIKKSKFARSSSKKAEFGPLLSGEDGAVAQSMDFETQNHFYRKSLAKEDQ